MIPDWVWLIFFVVIAYGLEAIIVRLNKILFVLEQLRNRLLDLSQGQP